MAVKGQLTERSEPFVTHGEDWDTLLVRVGQHLWKWRKENLYYPLETLDLALEDVWRVKREYRKPIKDRQTAQRKASGERLQASKKS
jgi:hypothetical protein